MFKISCYIGPRYNGTRLYSEADDSLQMTHYGLLSLYDVNNLGQVWFR